MASTMQLSPCITFNTPSGKPASFNSSARRPTLSGTFSDGLMIMQLPKAMALGIVQLGTMLGKLKGTIDATTPRGTYSVRHSMPLLTSSSSPVMSCGNEQANSVSSMDFSTSATASVYVLPFSSDTSLASSSKRWCSSCLYLKNTCTRSFIGVSDHPLKAAFADCTAASKSHAPDN